MQVKVYNLDTVSTTGSFNTFRGLPPPPGSSPGQSPNQRTPGITTGKSPAEKFGKLFYKMKSNKHQVKYLLKSAKEICGFRPGMDLPPGYDTRNQLIKAATSLKFCNNALIVKEVAGGHKVVNTWNCGKKYCAICASKKRNKLLRRYLDFFESAAGKKLTEKYDLAMFTVTLQHNSEDLRVEPYYKELSLHWRNGLKYGSFKKYLAGGFYNTEHTYTKNGHHIHRHALVLIPKEFNISQGERDKKKKTVYSRKVENELREQWLKRTDGSFQIDLTPFHLEKTLKENLLEVTKYITKRNKAALIPWQIVKAIDENCREKFYNKFGILYKIKELNINQINEEQNEEGELQNEILPEEKLFIGIGLKCKKDRKESIKQGKAVYTDYSFQELRPFVQHEKMWDEFRCMNTMNFHSWYQSQVYRYDSGYFADKWKEAKERRERPPASPGIVQYQGEFPF